MREAKKKNIHYIHTYIYQRAHTYACTPIDTDSVRKDFKGLLQRGVFAGNLPV